LNRAQKRLKKRKEKELSADSTPRVEPETLTDTTKSTEQNTATQSSTVQDSNVDKSPTIAPVATENTDVEQKTASTSSTNNAHTGVMSANSTATSKTKSSTHSNGNGSAPKNKKGALDPNRLPDSGQDNATNSTTKTGTETDTSVIVEKPAEQSELADKNSDK